MLDYKQKFLDPRWQKKRLLILQRDEFSCCKCGDKENTLHVHHKYYIFNKDPWDYDDIILETLCVSCHEEEGWDKEYFNGVIRHLLESGFNYEQLAQYISGLYYPLDYDKDNRVRIASLCAMTPEILDSINEGMKPTGDSLF